MNYTKALKDVEDSTCQFWCRIPCTRTATRTVMGWEDTPVCQGHALLMEWNRETWGYNEDDDLTELFLAYQKIKSWFKENPRP